MPKNSGNLNLLELSGPVQSCTETALPHLLQHFAVRSPVQSTNQMTVLLISVAEISLHFSHSVYLEGPQTFLPGPRSRDGYPLRGSNLGRGEIFCTRPDGPRGPHSPLYNWYWLCLPRVKRPGPGVYHPPSYRVKLRM